MNDIIHMLVVVAAVACMLLAQRKSTPANVRRAQGLDQVSSLSLKLQL